EACVRYLAADLGPSGVRVNAISSGPVRTLSASGVRDFRKLYGTFATLAPLRSNITIEDNGKTAIWLASDLSSAVTGEVIYVDGGFNVLGVPLAEVKRGCDQRGCEQRGCEQRVCRRGYLLRPAAMATPVAAATSRDAAFGSC